MNYDTHEKLKLNNLNTSFVPTLKGATSHDMLAKGVSMYNFTINEHTFTNSFIVCTKMSRPIILGRDFTIPNAITVGWTRQGTKKLCTDNDLVMETEENFEGKMLSLSRLVHIPPHTTAVVVVACITNMEGNFRCSPALFSSGIILTYIVNPLSMTCLWKSRLSKQISLICQTWRLKSTT